MKKRLWLLCLCMMIYCISSPNALTVIDASKNYSNGIKRIPLYDTVQFILSKNDSLRLSPIRQAELNLGLYYCYYGIGYGVEDEMVSISYKCEQWYDLRRQYDRMNGDSANFAQKMIDGWCITLGSPDTVWNNSLQYPETVTGCDTFQFGDQGEMKYFRARPIIEYYQYYPPPPEQSITRHTCYPEYSIIQYLSAKCLNFTRHLKIQVVHIDVPNDLAENGPDHSGASHTLWLCWAVDGPQGDGKFLPGTTAITQNPSVYSKQITNTTIRSYRQISLLREPAVITDNLSCYSLSGKLLPYNGLKKMAGKQVANGCYIILSK